MRAKILLLLAALAAASLASGCKSKPTQEARPAPSSEPAAARPVKVAHVSAPFKLDGELDEPPWNAVAGRTGPFTDTTGGEARPYSDARFLWDDENLYFGLYAADDNIHATITAHDGPVWIDDSFTIRFTPVAMGNPVGVPQTPPELPGAGAPTYQIDISAAGIVTDVKHAAGKDDPSWESGLKLGVDKDGTLNAPDDWDEEWVIEAALPLRSLGIPPKPGTRLLVDISRCDTPKGTKEKRCGSFGTQRAPRILELSP